MKDSVPKFYGPNKDGMSRLVNTHHFDRVKKMIEENHKGKIVEGDMSRADRNARYIPPTFIVDPSLSSTLMNEEIFGPVLPILTVKSVDEALKVVNSKDNPLAAYTFTENEAIAEQFLGNVQSGSACVNDLVSQINNPNMPFGGTGKSGIGAYHGKYTFECFSNKQSTLIRKTDNDDPKGYPPFHPKAAEMLKSAL
jgi:acyl-CoA reductase-like NAD-dependent aldehyde dehydrogenase